MQQNRPKSSAAVVLENQLKIIIQTSVPVVYVHLLQQIQFLFTIWTSVALYVMIYNKERTISKKFTIWKIGVAGFRIVEEHVVVCLKIGSHKTR